MCKYVQLTPGLTRRVITQGSVCRGLAAATISATSTGAAGIVLSTVLAALAGAATGGVALADRVQSEGKSLECRKVWWVSTRSLRRVPAATLVIGTGIACTNVLLFSRGPAQSKNVKQIDS